MSDRFAVLPAMKSGTWVFLASSHCRTHCANDKTQNILTEYSPLPPARDSFLLFLLLLLALLLSLPPLPPYLGSVKTRCQPNNERFSIDLAPIGWVESLRKEVGILARYSRARLLELQCRWPEGRERQALS